jgi:hypothetical protein
MKIISRSNFLRTIEIARNYSEQFLSVGWIFLLVGLALNSFTTFLSVAIMFMIAFIMRAMMMYLQVRLYVYDKKKNEKS